jgi:H+/gluconate symporter-like permease
MLGCLIALPLILIVAHIPLGTGLTSLFATGVSNMVRNMLLFWVGCTMFGEVMLQSGLAHSIAYWLSDQLGDNHAPTVCYLVTIILALGGMNLGTILVVYPIGVIMLSKAGYSKDILAACNFGGFWTLTCSSPLIPSAANSILTSLLGTSNTAGLVPGLAVAVFMLITTTIYIEWQVRAWKKKGRVFEDWDEVPSDNPEFRASLPPVWLALIPIIFVLVSYNVFNVAVAVALIGGSLVVVAIRFKKFTVKEWMNILEKGAYAGVVPTINLALMGGIGAVVAQTPFFTWALSWMNTTTLHPYVICWASTTVMAGFLGSSTSALATLVPSIKGFLDEYVAKGFDLGVMHRLLAVGSVSLDSLPHNGSMMACCAVLHTTMQKSYSSIFVTCTLIPLLGGLFVALPLALLGFI